jgi:Protein of unknown function (DUF3631)
MQVQQIGRVERNTGNGTEVLLDQSKAVGARVLSGVEAFISAYVHLPDGAALAIATWIMATHLFEAFDVFPYLAITSPVPRCGKSTLLAVIGMLSPNPIPAANISEAALFRTIDEDRPTLLLDEMEWLRQDSERGAILKNLLNAGHRSDAVTIRCEKDGSRRKFSVYCPKAIATIRDLSETLTDRSIRIPLQRKMAGEAVERFRFAKVKGRAEPIWQRIAEWVKKSESAVRDTYQTLPDLGFLDDRAADNWSPLFALVAVADFGRLGDLRRAAECLSSDRADDSSGNSLPLRLLSDAAGIAADFDGDIVPTRHLIAEAKKIEDSPWAEEDVRLTGRRVSLWLRGFEIRPAKRRAGATTVRGYDRRAIIEAWKRYGAAPDTPNATSATNATDKPLKDLRVAHVADVADEAPPEGEAHGDE